MDAGDESPVRYRPVDCDGTWADSGHFVVRRDQKYSVMTPDGKPHRASPSPSSADERAKWSKELAEMKDQLADSQKKLQAMTEEALEHTNLQLEMLASKAANVEMQKRLEQVRGMAAEQAREATLQASHNVALRRENERLKGEVENLNGELRWLRTQRQTPESGATPVQPVDSSSTDTRGRPPVVDHLDMVNQVLKMSDMVMEHAGRASSPPRHSLPRSGVPDASAKLDHATRSLLSDTSAAEPTMVAVLEPELQPQPRPAAEQADKERLAAAEAAEQSRAAADRAGQEQLVATKAEQDRLAAAHDEKECLDAARAVEDLVVDRIESEQRQPEQRQPETEPEPESEPGPGLGPSAHNSDCGNLKVSTMETRDQGTPKAAATTKVADDIAAVVEPAQVHSIQEASFTGSGEQDHVEPAEELEPEARFRLLYAQLVRENRTNDGGDSAEELVKLNDTLEEQGIDIAALVQEVEAAVLVESDVKETEPKPVTTVRPPKPSRPEKAPDMDDPSTSITLSFTLPADAAVEDSGIDLQYSGKMGSWKNAPAESSEVVCASCEDGSTLYTCTVRELKPGNSIGYTVRVRANNSAGTSEWSDRSSYLPTAKKPPSPRPKESQGFFRRSFGSSGSESPSPEDSTTATDEDELARQQAATVREEARKSLKADGGAVMANEAAPPSASHTNASNAGTADEPEFLSVRSFKARPTPPAGYYLGTRSGKTGYWKDFSATITDTTAEHKNADSAPEAEGSSPDNTTPSEETAAPLRSRTPERGADGKTRKEYAPVSRSQTPERTGAAGGRLQLAPAAGRNKTKRAKVVQDYQDDSETTISIAAGNIVRVLEELDHEWWEGHVEGASEVGYFPAAFVEVIDDSPAAAKKAEKPTAKQKVKHQPPPPKLDPWQDPNSKEYDPVRVEANAAFAQKQAADGPLTPKTKKQKQLAAIEKKLAEEKATKIAQGEFSAEQNAQLEKLEAEEKRLLSEYQKAFDPDSGMSKLQITAAGKVHAAAQAETKKYREATIAEVKQRNCANTGKLHHAAVDDTATRKQVGSVSMPKSKCQGGDGALKKIDVKGYLAERGLSDWYAPLVKQGNIVNVSQLENIYERKLMQVAKKADRPLSESEAKQLVERIKS